MSRRTLYTIAALAVVAVVILAGVAYYLDLHRYPSEDTPLVLQPWGISLIREKLSTDYDYPPPLFANISLAFGREGGGVYSHAPTLSLAKQYNVSDFSLPNDFSMLDFWSWESDEVVDGVRVLGPSGIFITDEDGDGLFDYGDAVSLFTCIYEDGILTHQGFYPNTVYLFALAPHGSPVFDHWQFKLAMHHGDLHSWQSYWYQS